MKTFNSIESLRHVIKNVERWCSTNFKPLPTITYRGTVKLHGTNAGVRVTLTKVQAQGRNRILDIQSDNFGFAAWCHNKNDMFRDLAKIVMKEYKDLTFFGEWVGTGIQKNVAVSEIPKHFVLFKAWDNTTEKYLSIEEITAYISLEKMKEYNNAGLFFINQIPLFTVVVNFAQPKDVLETLEEYTLIVEKECPWANFHGVKGTGEGLVWSPCSALHPDLADLSDLWFKTKGLEHKRSGSKVKLEIEPKKINDINDFVNQVLPLWRLEQGISQLKEDGLEIIPENTGAYIKWISKDVIKEESDRLAANNLCWKDVSGPVAKAAKNYYFKEIDSLC